MKTTKIVLIFFSFLFLLSACAGFDSSGDASFEDKIWVLATLNGIDLIENHQPTIQFEAGQVSGNASCNHYGGGYLIKGEKISFEVLYSTEMACLDPIGVMEQEQIYLELLRAATRFKLVDGALTIFTDSEQTMTFHARSTTDAGTTIIEQPSPISHTQTAEVLEPTPTLTFKPPVGFKEYQDSVVGVSVYIPENWLVIRDIERQIATFQSYPEEKYVGREEFEPGDTKCQLIIQPTGTTTQRRLDQYRSVGITTIFSEEEIVLSSGKTATRLEVDIMGDLLTLVVAEVKTRVIVFQCFGDCSEFDAIATTLRATE